MNARTPLLLAALLLASASAQASDLALRARSNGASQVTVTVGSDVPYEIVGELSDPASQGLAMFTFDLHFTGGPLPQASAPAPGSTMDSFSAPQGFSNPSGYGGHPLNGDLLQVGGAQNTIRNQFAPIPTGTVTTGVALPGSPQVLVSGVLQAPATPGSYVLQIQDPMANVIRLGSNGIPFWPVDAAGIGLVIDLLVDVIECPLPTTYCVGKQSSQGCTASIGFLGSPSLSGPDDFRVTVAQVVNGQNGLVFWGLAPANVPFQGGIRCVDHPIVRMATVNSRGTSGPPQNCSGAYDVAFPQAYMLQKGLTPGTGVFAQCWYRDPAAADGTGVGLSNALSFVICP
jgi:hypothetical protein